jgi:hypothetical protein
MRLPSLLLVAALSGSACNTNNPFLTQPTDTSTPAVAKTDTFEGSVTVNGGTTNPFIVERAGTVTAVVSALEPPDATVGFMIGTWNSTTNSCQLVIVNDAAVAGNTLIGTASVAGNFCVRVFDAGKMTSPVNFQVQVTHY